MKMYNKSKIVETQTKICNIRTYVTSCPSYCPSICFCFSTTSEILEHFWRHDSSIVRKSKRPTYIQMYSHKRLHIGGSDNRRVIWNSTLDKYLLMVETLCVKYSIQLHIFKHPSPIRTLFGPICAIRLPPRTLRLTNSFLDRGKSSFCTQYSKPRKETRSQVR